MGSYVNTGQISGRDGLVLLRWFADRRIGTKIITTAAVGIVLAVLVGGLALFRIGDLHTYRQQEIGRAVP